MDTDNIHYLVSKVRTLEEENKELEGLNDSLLSRNKELVKRSKEAEKELEFIDYLDKTIVESKLEKNDLSNNAAVIYQKELVKAERRIKELENHNDESIHGFYNEDEMAEKIEQQLKPYINSEEPSEY